MCVKPRPAYSIAVVHHGGSTKPARRSRAGARLSAGDPDRRGPLSGRAHQRQRVRPEDQAVGDAALARAGRHVAGEADRPRRQQRRRARHSLRRSPGCSLPDDPPGVSLPDGPPGDAVDCGQKLKRSVMPGRRRRRWRSAPARRRRARGCDRGSPPPGRRSTASDPRKSRGAPAATRDRRRRRADTAPA